ncbi:hypothetical protein [Micromonospora sp. LOL_023]|uniref:hypothetical protein n=1 Tax=Micromonospora sp. LOL_023 TaxID=3345418 RepID=UPI003A8433E5
MRRLTTLLVAFLIAMGGLFATTAVPASADYPDPSGGTLRNVYSDLQFCHWVGSSGVQNGTWSSYLCQYRQYGSGPNSVLYFFWTFD